MLIDLSFDYFDIASAFLDLDDTPNEVVIDEAVSRAICDGLVKKQPGLLKARYESKPISFFSLAQIFDSGAYSCQAKFVLDFEKGYCDQEIEVTLRGGGLVRDRDYERQGRPRHKVRIRKPRINRMVTRDRVTLGYAIEIIVAAEMLGVPSRKPGRCCCEKRFIRPALRETFGANFPVWRCGRCGSLLVCDCHASRFKEIESRLPYDERPEIVRSGICHICRGMPSTIIFKRHNCRSSFERFYAPYIWAEYSQPAENREDSFKLAFKEAENLARAKFGLPMVGEGWLNETLLFRLVETIFPGEEVVREASPEWLEGQRYDVFVPARKIAFEYNGEQHYAPVSLFGGEAAFLRTVKRDESKRRKSRAAGVILIEIPYYEIMTADGLRRAVERAGEG